MLEWKAIYRRIEGLLDEAKGARSRERFAARFVPRLLEELGEPLGIAQAHLFDVRHPDPRPLGRWGEEGADPLPAVAAAMRDGAATRDGRELPWLGHTGAGPVGLLSVGEGEAPLLALVFRGEETAAQSAFVSSLHYMLAQNQRRRDLEHLVAQARAIQLSLLPAAAPRFDGYDIAAVSVPAEDVGGDLYDFLEIDADVLGIAVADASGHGLPAALQARDVATGLRMGVERDLKITRTVEKLNRVIHASGLVTRFVSMVFGELEANGSFAYINAGHPPPLLLDESGVHELSVGGMILGPDPRATYKLGFAHVDRGAILALFTDGVVECGLAEGRPFGTEGVTRWMSGWRGGPAGDAVGDLLERLRAHGGGRPFADDVTAVLVRRLDPPREAT